MKVKLFLIALVTLLLGACASAPTMFMPSQAEYIKMTADEQAKADEEAPKIASSVERWWEKVGSLAWNSHQPVTFGPEGSQSTMQWIVMPNSEYDVVQLNLNHNPTGMDGQTTTSMYVAVADKKGAIVTMKGANGVVAPNKILAQVSNEEDFRRLLARGVFQIGAASANGLLGQIYRTERGDCGGDGCGSNGTVVVNQVKGGEAVAASVAQSAANTAVKAAFGSGCATCVPLE